MVRLRRIRVQGEDAYYHIISRTVHQQYLLGDIEKEVFVKILKRFAEFYFVKVIGYCVMSNHFHLLIKMEPEHKYTDAEIEERVRRNVKLTEGNSIIDIKYYRKRLENISEYMRQVKQSFSRWYNKVYRVKGTFWSDRYKSILVEPGEALETVLAYLELNPIRAKMVEKPEDYRYSSFGYRASHRKDKLLSFDGLSFSGMKNAISKYKQLVYKWGGIEKSGKGKISETVIQNQENAMTTTKTVDYLTHKIRYFTDGLVVGSKLFLKNAYAIFGGKVIMKKGRKTYKTGVGDEILSVRRLIE